MKITDSVIGILTSEIATVLVSQLGYLTISYCKMVSYWKTFAYSQPPHGNRYTQHLQNFPDAFQTLPASRLFYQCLNSKSMYKFYVL